MICETLHRFEVLPGDHRWSGIGAELNFLSVCFLLRNPVTTPAIPQELHRDALPSLEQLTTSITVLALHASPRPVDAPRVREVFGQLLETIHQAETDMAVFDLP